VAVFGDEHEAVGTAGPRGSYLDFDFPEKGVVENKSDAPVERVAMEDPLKELVVKTKSQKQPQITLFLLLPGDVRDPGEIRGVVAACMLANTVDDVKKTLQGAENSVSWHGLVDFAKQNKMAILCWGSRKLWDPKQNYDDEDMENPDFDEVADAWERGVRQLSEKYGIPNKDYLLWGFSAAAQWSHRLAMRKPQYFLAIHIHIPSSFDRPRPAASSILWLLTTGELEGGYEYSREFVSDCQSLGYPILYKAVPNLAHDDSPAFFRVCADPARGKAALGGGTSRLGWQGWRRAVAGEFPASGLLRQHRQP
jgi:predicted esterase